MLEEQPEDDPGTPARPRLRKVVRLAAVFLLYGVIAAVTAVPVAVEQTIEHTRFEDRIGAVPVEVSLSHNGLSTVDTGVLGRLYWEQTGAGGFGAYVRVTGTPEAGGTLASYASPRFVRTNAVFVNDPAAVADAYGAELKSRFVKRLLLTELVVLLIGGLLLTLIARGRLPRLPGRRSAVTAAVGVLVGAVGLGTSTATSLWLFSRWDGSTEVTDRHPMPGVDGLSFSSPQTLEVARQLQPFLEKNNARIQEQTEEYQAAVAVSLQAALEVQAAELMPRTGEQIVIAEADPQGSIVGTKVRSDMYEQLRAAIGGDVIAVRTISGDITSNGTVAEAGFVEDEANASGDIPVVAVKGDHDTDETVEQLMDNGVTNPDLEVAEVGDLRLVAANDPAFKSLFGGLVVNETGVSESEAGEILRDEVDGETDALIVLFHQPRSAAGYIGIDSLDDLESAESSRTPRDDGIPDLPPGIINIGHLHDAAPPQIIWNTDTDEVSWTIVNQLGTSGGVEERPTYNRFSTPFSVPLKTLSVQLQYVDVDTGLQTGSVSIEVAIDGAVTISPRIDLGP